MTTQVAVTTTKRPTWATLVASGFIGVGVGSLLLAIAMVAGGAMDVIGIAVALIALGVAVGSFGGYAHFASRH